MRIDGVGGGKVLGVVAKAKAGTRRALRRSAKVAE